MAATRDRWDAFSVSFQHALRDAGEAVSKAAGIQLVNACDDWIRKLDEGSETDPDIIPFLTGNLHDSIVASVSQKGRLIGVRQMDKVATEDQKYRGRSVNGHLEGMRIAMAAPRPEAPTANLFIGAPYADAVNQNVYHVGYVERLEESFVNAMERKLHRLESLRYKTR